MDLSPRGLVYSYDTAGMPYVWVELIRWYKARMYISNSRKPNRRKFHYKQYVRRNAIRHSSLVDPINIWLLQMVFGLLFYRKWFVDGHHFFLLRTRTRIIHGYIQKSNEDWHQRILSTHTQSLIQGTYTLDPPWWKRSPKCQPLKSKCSLFYFPIKASWILNRHSPNCAYNSKKHKPQGFIHLRHIKQFTREFPDTIELLFAPPIWCPIAYDAFKTTQSQNPIGCFENIILSWAHSFTRIVLSLADRSFGLFSI